MKKVMLIFGTRPEAIKLAPVLKELQKFPNQFEIVVCVTSQHRQMLDQVLDVFNIIPDYDLDIMKPGQDLFDVTCNVLQGIKPVIEEERPDIALAQGDTTTAMATALSCYYCQVPIGHIEAGLRTNNKFAPFPEEINRKIVGAIADIHFAPTEWARENLLREGISDATIFVTGNTVIDALFSVIKTVETNAQLKEQLATRFSFLGKDKRLILVTGHRRENFGDGFENICQALAEIAERHSDVDIIYPVHLNPNVQEPVRRTLSHVESRNIFLIEPIDYLPFIYLMNRSYMIITDSGGIQEEAPSLGKPVLVMREKTERPEAVTAGTAKLVGTDRSCIVRETERLLTDKNAYQTMAMAYNPYGDGKAAERIIAALR
jgi:UDP-N-acetylglucosamine 2-epimerase (non-hydrolysing)